VPWRKRRATRVLGLLHAGVGIVRDLARARETRGAYSTPPTDFVHSGASDFSSGTQRPNPASARLDAVRGATVSEGLRLGKLIELVNRAQSVLEAGGELGLTFLCDGR
jgi:hypothetical protein